MGCPRGGGHRWRQMRAKSEASGFLTLQQCKKCGNTRETIHPVVIIITALIALVIIGAVLNYYGFFDQLQQ